MRHRTAWCVVAGSVLGVSLSVLWPRSVAAAEPRLDVANGFVSLPLRDDTVVLPQARVALDGQAIRKPQAWAVWSRPHYRGTVGVPSVERLIHAGKADALESRLTAAAKAKLALALVGPTRRLRDAARLMQAEAERIRQGHWADQSCAIRIRAYPAKTDPRWPEVVALRKRLSKGRTGLMLSAQVPGKPQQVSFIAVRWKTFPAYAALRREQEMACNSRQLAVRRWVGRRYAREGLAIFDQ